MNMLTGIFSPTSGTVLINGHNITTQTKAARKSLALCPQHNVLYDVLTVTEHLKFFAGIKGMSGSDMNDKVNKLVEQFELQDVRNTRAKDLSAGMKRKLCLGNAIIGGSKVLILDEPTTGLDPESRRIIWDIVQKLRSEHTILLTTHYMEEADTLGDRVAIIGNGTLHCYGSPLYLKKKFGDGYHLSIEKGINCKVDNITNIIRKHIPDGKLLNNASHELRYSLSLESEQFSSLFKDIERASRDLDILSYGVSITTMDDVFMKVGEESEKRFQEENERINYSMEQNFNGETPDKEYSTNSDRRLTQQMKALIFKRFHYSKRQIPLLFLQFTVPLVAAALFIFLKCIPIKKEILDIGKMAYDLDAMFPETKYGFYSIEGNRTENVESLAMYYTELLKEENAKIDNPINASEYLVNKGKEGRYSYLRKYLTGITLEEIERNLSINVWSNGIHYNVEPVSINLVTNTLLRYLANDTSLKIQTACETFISSHKSPPYALKEAYDILNHFANSFIFTFGLAFLSATFILFPIYERASKAKLLQIMCGVNGAVHCMMNIVWDFAIYIICVLLMLIPFFIYHGIHKLIAIDSVGAAFLILVLYGLASLSFSYLLSYVLTSPSAGFITAMIINCFFGIVAPFAMYLWKWVNPFSKVADVLFWFLCLIPNVALTFGIYDIHNLGVVKIKCFNLKENEHSKECVVGINRPNPYCCAGPSCNGTILYQTPYLSFEDDGAGKECLALAIGAILYFCIMFVLEQYSRRIQHTIMDKSKSRKIKEDISQNSALSMIETNQDNDVLSEHQRIQNLLHRKAVNEEALIICDLTKYFGSLAAVKELTFGIHKEECFGLLGVNGAGKSTTFEMLAGGIPSTKGNAFIGNSSIKHEARQFQISTGYCPQNNSFIEDLSGRETLELFANLRGIPKSAIKDTVNHLLLMCGIDKEADQLARDYSGGTKRKLSVAVALIGTPPVILLDEPTTSVDPLSRRKLWKTLSSMKRVSGVSFVLTSHSMDECEALCNRIAIMVNGKLHYIGTMQRLRAKFCQGYSLIIKACTARDTNSSKLQDIKAFIQCFFPSAILRLELQGMLHYQITDTSLQFSHMFSVMEKAKQKFQLADYMLFDNPLEQVFLALASTQKEYVPNIEITNF